MSVRKIAKIGNSGPKSRSDCYVQLELMESGNIQLNLKSRVAELYQKSITELVYKVLEEFEITHARIELIDRGALPWVIMARLEAAIKQLKTSSKEFLPNSISENCIGVDKQRQRINQLYLSANEPGYFINAGLHKPHGIVFNLEDMVHPAKKHEARFLVRNSLLACNFYGAECMVQINQGAEGTKDLEVIIPHGPVVVLVPNVEDPKQVIEVEEVLDKIRVEKGIDEPIYMVPIIETPLGVEQAFTIARSSSNIVALAFDSTDYALNMGISNSIDGTMIQFAKNRMVNACHAASIQALDSIYYNFNDTESLLEYAKESRSNGFSGMGCIHPKQIKTIGMGFVPDADQLNSAKQITFAARKAKERGNKQVVLGTKIIDSDTVSHQKKLIDMALSMGVLEDNWMSKMD